MITRADLDEQYAIVKQCHADNKMNRDQYLKCVLALAYEHAVIGNMEDVRLMVDECDDTYIANTMPQQMRDSAVFHTVAHFVASKLAGQGRREVSDEEVLLAFARTGRA